MAINLSDITFTDETDIVPSIDGEPTLPESIFLFGATVNTLAGSDIIQGSEYNGDANNGLGYGFSNYLGTLNTNSGHDRITGIYYENQYTPYSSNSGIVNRGSFVPSETGVATINTGDGDDVIEGMGGNGSGIKNVIGIIDTGDGNDLIYGQGYRFGIITEVTTIDTGNGNDTIYGNSGGTGIDSRVNTTINTGDGNDIITGWSGSDGWGILLVDGAIDTGEGNDIIDGSASAGSGLFFATNGFGGVESRIDTGEGDDIITGTGADYGILNAGTVNTGNGADSLISQGTLFNSGGVFLGDGNDSITANTVNSAEIITSAGIIYNQGVINTGNGADSIIVDGGFNGTGSVFLGEGEDYIKGFGSGEFSGGNGFDRLELTPGSYTVGISPAGGNFAKDGIIMNTVGFEKLIVGSTSYDFTSLTEGQIIVVA